MAVLEHDTQGTMNHTERAWFGFNPGHGWTKVALLRTGQDIVTIEFPSLVAKARPQAHGDIRRIPTVRFDDADWWVGEHATFGAIEAEYTQARLTNPHWIPVLIRAALDQTVDHLMHEVPHSSKEEQDSVITSLLGEARFAGSLPATWSQEKPLSEALFRRIREGAAPFARGKGRIIAEPTACVYSVMLDRHGQMQDDGYDQGKVGVLDFGFGTVDGGIVDRRVTRRDSLETVKLGALRPLMALKKRLETYFEVELSLYDVDLASRTGIITIDETEQPLPEGWGDLFRDAAYEAAKHFRTAWGPGRDLYAMLVGGGGAARPATIEGVQAIFKRARVVPEPQASIAIGCAKYACYMSIQGLW